MKKRISLTYTLLIFVAIFFMLGAVNSLFYFSGIKKVGRYSEIDAVLSNIEKDIIEMEYVMDVFIVGGYYVGNSGIEGIYEKVALVDERIGRLQGLPEIEVLLNNPLAHEHYDVVISNWSAVKDKSSILNTSSTKEDAFLIHNDIDLKTFLIKEGISGIKKYLKKERATFLSDVDALITKSLVLFLAMALIALYFFYRRNIKPIGDMTASAKKMVSGDLNVRIQANSFEEINTLADTVNELADKVVDISSTIEKRVSERTAELETKKMELAFMSNIRGLIGRIFSRDKFFVIVLDELLLLTKADAGWICLVGNNDERLQIEAYRGLSHGLLTELKRGISYEDATMGQFTNGRKYIVMDVHEVTNRLRPLLDEMDFKVLCILPVNYQNETCGVIILASRERDVLERKELSSFLGAVADDIALVDNYFNLFQKEYKARQFMERIISQFPQNICIFEKDGTCILINPACLKLFGINNEQQVVGRYNIFKDTVLQEKGYNVLAKHVLAGRIVEMECEYDVSRAWQVLSSAGQKKIRTIMFPIVANDGTVTNIAAMYEDITDSKARNRS